MSELTGVDADEMLGKGDYEYSIPFYGERKAILVDMALNPKIHKIEHYNILTHEGDVIIGETSVPMIKGGSAYLWGEGISSSQLIRRDNRSNREHQRLHQMERD